MSPASSLFEARQESALAPATEWVTSTLFGSLAVTLCVIAVAFVGLMLMSGRFAVREGTRVAIGAFVLLGAPLVAAGLRGAADEAAVPGPALDLAVEAPPAPPLPAANYDPYAGASLRSD